MSDLIERQTAIEIFTQLWDCIGTIMDRDEWEDVCKTTANELPSAQRKWKWKYEKMKHILNGEVRTVRICSECNGGWFRYDLSDGVEDVEPNYCPNCGAEMVKGEEDEDN